MGGTLMECTLTGEGYPDRVPHAQVPPVWTWLRMVPQLGSPHWTWQGGTPMGWYATLGTNHRTWPEGTPMGDSTSGTPLLDLARRKILTELVPHLKKYLICHGQYASCNGAGGLSCFDVCFNVQSHLT